MHRLKRINKPTIRKGGVQMKRRTFIKTLGIGCLGCCCTPLSTLAGNVSPSKGALAGSRAFLNPLGAVRSGPRAVSSPDGKTYNAKELLKEYDSKLGDKRALYATVFGEDEVDGILQEMRATYEDLIPDIPYIGERNYHLQYLIPSSEELAEYLVAKNYSMTTKSFGTLRLEHAEEQIMAMPETLRLMIGRSTLTPLALLKMRMVAYRSQHSSYPDESLCTYIPGDGVEFDWGADYTRCTTDILYAKYDATDLMIDLTCKYDFIPGKAFNIGYYRTMILPEGAPMCDLRFKWGKEVEMPE